MKTKVVLRGPILTQKSRSKALKVVVGVPGMESASLSGEDIMELTGDGIDVVELMRLLRKNLGSFMLLSVEAMEYGGRPSRTSYWHCRSGICVSHPQCAEAAVVGVEHGIEGQDIYVLVTLAKGVPYSEELRESLVLTVKNQIPESNSGFIDKNVIYEELENHPAQPSNVEHVADANSSDQQQNGEDMYSDDEIDLT